MIQAFMKAHPLLTPVVGFALLVSISHAAPKEVPGSTRSLHGKMLLKEGAFAKADKELRAAVALQTEKLGAWHPETLKSRMDLALALRNLRRQGAAEVEYRAVLKIRRRVLGDDHPDTVQCRSNLSEVLCAQGKFAEAEEESRAVLDARIRTLGEEHPDTLWSRNNLAFALCTQQKYGEQVQEYRKVLAVRERLLGADHAQTLESHWQIADALYSGQKYAEAELEYRAALAAYLRVEEKHGYTAYCRIRLAHTLAALGRDEEAEQQHRERLKLYEQALAAGNPNKLAQCQENTFSSHYQLAQCLDRQADKLKAAGNDAGAQKLWEEALLHFKRSGDMGTKAPEPREDRAPQWYKEPHESAVGMIERKLAGLKRGASPSPNGDPIQGEQGASDRKDSE